MMKVKTLHTIHRLDISFFLIEIIKYIYKVQIIEHAAFSGAVYITFQKCKYYLYFSMVEAGNNSREPSVICSLLYF